MNSFHYMRLLLIACLVRFGAGFGVILPRRPCTPNAAASNQITRLFMGKGLNRARNKQADLARKLELAREQNQRQTVPSEEEGEKSLNALTDSEIKKRNDRLRFEELLKQESSNVLNAYSRDGYLSKEQEEEEITAARSGTDRLFEGDPAPSEPFEELVNIVSGNAIGKLGAEKIVPWLHKNLERQQDFLLVLTDPRMKSPELRQTMKALSTELPKDLLSRMIVVNVDSDSENRRWLKKNGLLDNALFDIYSDEKMEFMRAYTALGEKRFAMCMFVLAKGRVQKLAREVDSVQAGRVIQNAVKSMED